MVRISYHNNDQPTAQEVAELFRRSGIRRPADDPARIGAMLENADIVLTARHGPRLVGIARGLTDHVYVCYLSDLAVDSEFQRQGIGKKLLELLKAQLSDQVMILLLAAPEAADYYEPLGYTHAPNAWLINRTR
jgi:ribosomal protein S18 acetylase RimI-like enzyme